MKDVSHPLNMTGVGGIDAFLCHPRGSVHDRRIFLSTFPYFYNIPHSVLDVADGLPFFQNDNSVICLLNGDLPTPVILKAHKPAISLYFLLTYPISHFRYRKAYYSVYISTYSFYKSRV